MYTHIERIYNTVGRNLGLKDYSQYIDSWVEWAFEAELLIGSRDTFEESEYTYSSTGASASGSIAFTSNPSYNDSITLNGVTLFFRDNSNTTNLNQQVPANAIGLQSNLADTLTELVTELRGTNSPADSAGLIFADSLEGYTYTIEGNLIGDDLITNGDFSSSLGSEWDLTLSGGGGSIALSSSQLLFTQSSSVQMYASQDFTTVAGNHYELSVDLISASGNQYHRIRAGTSQNSDDLAGTNYGDLNVGATNKLFFTATGTTTWITLNDAQGGSSTSLWDNVIVKEAETLNLVITDNEVGIDGNNYTLESSDVNAQCSSSHLTGGKGLLSNQQLRLPDNMVKLLGVRVGANSTKDRHRELRKPTTIHKQRVGKDVNETKQRAFRYYIQGNKLNIQHDQIDEITIVCSSYPVDAKGYPMIKDSHTTAVAQYVMWQHKNIDYINGRLSMYVVKDLEKRWYFLCAKARGDDNMPTSEELKQIGRIWNTMVPIKSSTGLLDL